MLSSQDASEIPQEDTMVSQKTSTSHVLPQHWHTRAPLSTKISHRSAF